MRVRLSLLTGLLLWNAALPAQQPTAPASPDVPVFRTSTDLVTIDAVVMDGDGKPVTNLTREDFEVTVAGKHQTLEQAVYIRTQEQPRALAAARAAAVPSGSDAAPRRQHRHARRRRGRSRQPVRHPSASRARSRWWWTISDSRSEARSTCAMRFTNTSTPRSRPGISSRSFVRPAASARCSSSRPTSACSTWQPTAAVGLSQPTWRRRFVAAATGNVPAGLGSGDIDESPRRALVRRIDGGARVHRTWRVAAARPQVHRVLLRRVRSRSSGIAWGSEQRWAASVSGGDGAHARSRQRGRRGDLHDRCAGPGDWRAEC